METTWEHGRCGSVWPLSGFPLGLLCGFQPGPGVRNDSLRLGQCVLRGAASQAGAAQRDGEHWEAEGTRPPAPVVLFPQWPTLEALCIVVMQSSLS